MKYTLTQRGIWFVRILLLILASGIFYFGSSLLAYLAVETPSSNEGQVQLNHPNPKAVHVGDTLGLDGKATDTKTDTKTDEKYTLNQLEDLKIFRMDFDFKNETTHLTSAQKKELDYLIAVLSRYPKEPITLEVKGVEDEITHKLIQYLTDGKMDESQIEVKTIKEVSLNHMGEKVLSIYFTNHYHLAKSAK